MRTADAIRLIERIRFDIHRYPVPDAIEALHKMEVWVREGAGMEDVHGVDPRIDREKHAGREDVLDRDAGSSGNADDPGTRPRKGSDRHGRISDADIARRVRRINKYGRREDGI